MAETEVHKWQTQQDGFANLAKSTEPIPTPRKDEVLVRISTVSLNYRDTEGNFLVSTLVQSAS